MFRFLLVSIVATLAGCGTASSNPLYFEADLVQENVFLGNWHDTSGSTTKVEAVSAKEYQIKLPQEASPKTPEIIRFRLLKLGDHHFVDAEAPQFGHVFARVAILGDKVYMRSFEDDWLKKRLRQFPTDILHRIDREIVQPDKSPSYPVEDFVLTAKTNELQAFVLKFVDDPVAFGGAPFDAYSKVGRIPIAQVGLASKKYRTFNYWYEARMALYGVSFPKGAKPDIVATTLDNLSKMISDLPTVGVDLEAAESVNDAARMFRSMASAVRDSNDGGRLVEAFVRGWAGDPFGVAAEQIQSQKRLQQELSHCLMRLDKARVLLTDRYEMEFQAIK